MTIDALNDLPTGGTWVKLRAKGDAIEGELIGAEWRDRTDLQGNPVYKRGTTKVRRELILTLQVAPEGGDDDGIRKVPCNESAQRAINEAGGKTWAVGSRIKLGVVADAEDAMSQATYKAKLVAAPAPLAAVEDEDELF